MRLPTTFSKIVDKLSPNVGYDKEKEPRSQRDIVVDLKTRVEEAHTHMQDRNAEIVKWRRYILGEGQKDKYLKELHDMDMDESAFIVTNFARALIAHLISLLTAAMGTPYVVPYDDEQAEESGLKEAADNLTQYLQALRHRDNYSRELRNWFEDAAVTGCGWVRAFYDPWKEEVFLRHQDAATVYPEPNAKTMDEAEFVAIRHVYNVGFARRLYPELDLKKCAEAGPPEHQEEGRGARMLVKQIEVWEVYHDFGDMLTIYSGDQILHSGEAPVTGEGHPLFPFTFIPSNHEVRGHPLLEDIEEVQDFYNRIVSRMDWYTRFWANPMVKVNDPNADIETRPGSIWRYRQGFEADAVHPPDFPSELFGMLHNQQESMDTITGIQEVNRGKRPEGISAGVALDILRQTSEQRQHGPLQDATAVIGAASHYLVKLLQTYYDSSRRVGFDNDGEAQFASVAPSQLRGIYSEQDEELDTWVPVLKPHEFIVLMQPPGDLPKSPAAKLEMAIQFYQMGAIDDVALLEMAKFEGRKEVLQRKAQMMEAQMEGQAAGMQERQAMEQQMMEQQMMEAQAGGPPGPPA